MCRVVLKMERECWASLYTQHCGGSKGTAHQMLKKNWTISLFAHIIIAQNYANFVCIILIFLDVPEETIFYQLYKLGFLSVIT